MTQLQVTDTELLAKLQSGERVEVVNADGRVIGVVTFTAISFPEFGLTDAEFEARLNDLNATWHTTDEVVQLLLSRIRKVA